MVIDDSHLRNRRYVFEDRADAGRALSQALKAQLEGEAIVLAVPSGGIPVAVSISKELGWPLDLVIVRKLQIPFEPEAGFGAITLSGEMILNRELVADLGLTSEDIERARAKALEQGRLREKALRSGRKTLPIKGKNVVLVDDGLASGYTMLAAIGQVKHGHPGQIVVAVPTGSEDTVRMVSGEVDMLICLNIRRGPFAVADAYRKWYDLSEEEAASLLSGI